MEKLLVLLLLVLVQVIYNVELAPHHSKASRGFKSFLCRLRHRKTIIDFNGQPNGCVGRCPNNYDERYSLRWGHYCKQIVLPEGCADRYCISCIWGYKWFYTYPITSRCIKSCPIGYTEINRICQRCYVNGCTDCSDNKSSCKKCANDKALLISSYNTKCVSECPLNYDKVDTEGDLKCVIKVVTTRPPPTTKMALKSMTIQTKIVVPKGCEDKECTVCTNGFIKFVSPEGSWERCVVECPLGYTNVSSICLACSDRRCASCKNSRVECARCFQGYIMQLDASNNTMECVRKCPKSHREKTLNNMTVCTPKPKPECPVTNCKRCLRSGLHSLHAGCEQCDGDYKLFRGTFKDHCYTDCPTGYYSAKRPGTEILNCGKCKVPFCSSCSDAKTCHICIAPMVLDGYGRCNTCPPKKHYSFDEQRCVSKTKMGNSVFKLLPEKNVVVEDSNADGNAKAEPGL